MRIDELEFDGRQDETVLMHGARAVGIVMPSGSRAFPAMGSVGQITRLFGDADRAKLWVLGKYLCTLSDDGQGQTIKIEPSATFPTT